MSHEGLERLQAPIYLAAIALGLALGSAWPALAPLAELALWPALMLLLTAVFVAVPLGAIAAALADRRFLALLLAGNFLLLPIIAIVLAQPVPDPALRLGVLLVLLPPCTDWFISFCRQGGGDTARAIAASPLLLALQLLLLPAYLWLAEAPLPAGGLGPSVAAAALVIGVPLLLAALAERSGAARRVQPAAAWVPVPALALVVGLIAVAHAPLALAAGPWLAALVPRFAAFLLVALLLALLLARLARLPEAQGRCLAFSFGTRNSFVVLPLAAALPAGWEAAVLAIVVQALVELVGMLAYLLVVPRLPWRHGLAARGPG